MQNDFYFFLQKGMFTMDNSLEYYVKEYERENFLVQNELAASRFFHGLRMEMDQSMGQGQSEILRIHNRLSARGSESSSWVTSVPSVNRGSAAKLKRWHDPYPIAITGG